MVSFFFYLLSVSGVDVALLLSPRDSLWRWKKIRDEFEYIQRKCFNFLSFFFFF